jgi:nicotinamidase/pyrazinamidase
MRRYRPGVALLVVDVQNDFADPHGSLSVRGGADVIPVINDQVKMARAAGALVVCTQDWHPAHTPHFAKDGGTWPDHCIRDSWGSALHPALEIAEGTPIVRKGANGEDGYSGFTMRDPLTGETIPTMLEGLLGEAGVEEVIVTGLATDYCVKATALDAIRLGFATLVLTDAVAAVDLQAGDGDRALAELRGAGARLLPARNVVDGGAVAEDTTNRAGT